jgi:glycosyltransferase involved in cell wall biosynthesis
MRIAFDHQAFCLQKTGGISRYFSRLSATLAKEYASDQVNVFAPIYRNEYLSHLSKSLVSGYRVSDYPPKMATAIVAVNRLMARRRIASWRPDIVHETYFSTSRSAPKNCPTILTVFDMISELSLGDLTSFSPVSTLKNYVVNPSKAAAIARADSIICISQQTRQDLLQIYPVPENKVSVVYLGCDAAPEVLNKNVNSVSNRPYLLYVGLRTGYKNFTLFLRALASSRKLLNDFNLICFGGGAFSANERALILELGFELNQIKQVAGEDKMLNTMYKNAAAFIYPSLYEGFGLPPLEAMANNCPVICSQTSSIPEVVGSAGQYFDPNSVESMRNAIELVVYSTTTSSELIARGHARVKQFSWERCAKETHQTYCSLLSATHELGSHP